MKFNKKGNLSVQYMSSETTTDGHKERIDCKTYIGSFSEAGIQFVRWRGGEDVLHHANSQPSALRAR